MGRLRRVGFFGSPFGAAPSKRAGLGSGVWPHGLAASQGTFCARGAALQRISCSALIACEPE